MNPYQPPAPPYYGGGWDAPPAYPQPPAANPWQPPPQNYQPGYPIAQPGCMPPSLPQNFNPYLPGIGCPQPAPYMPSAPQYTAGAPCGFPPNYYQPGNPISNPEIPASRFPLEQPPDPNRFNYQAVGQPQPHSGPSTLPDLHRPAAPPTAPFHEEHVVVPDNSGKKPRSTGQRAAAPPRPPPPGSATSTSNARPDTDYQHGLQAMASLMTDMNDDEMNAVRQAHGIK